MNQKAAVGVVFVAAMFMSIMDRKMNLPNGRWYQRPAENLGDLERHAADFAARSGFTYRVTSTLTSTCWPCTIWAASRYL
jgi:hypothetical protein